MFHLQPHVLARRAIGFELIGDHDARRSRRLLQKLVQKATRGRSISSALDQNVENEAILIDGAPEPMLLAADRDDDLVQVPLIAANGRTLPNAIGIFAAEFLGPLTDGFVANADAAPGQAFPRPSANSEGIENRARPHSR